MTSARSGFTRPDLVLLLLLGAVWGLSALFVRVVVEEVAPLWLVGGRILAGLGVTAVYLLVRRRRVPRQARTWRHLAVLGLVAMAVPWLLMATAGRHIPAGLATVLGAPTPAMTLGIAASVGVERLSRVRLGGMALALAGVVLIVSGSATTSGRLGSVGLVLVSVALFAGGAVYAKRYLSGIDPAVAVVGQLLVAAVAVLPAAWWIEPEPDVTALAPAVVAAWLALGCLATGGAFVLYYGLIERVGASNAMLVTYVSPGVGLLAGWLLLGERIGVTAVVGLAVVVPGLWLSQHQPVEETYRLDRRPRRPKVSWFRRFERGST